MKKLLAAAVIAGTALMGEIPRAHAGGSTDAALALGAFAVFNQLVRGETVFNGFFAAPPIPVAPPPVVVYAPPAPATVYYVTPPPAVYVAPPPVVYRGSWGHLGHKPVKHAHKRHHHPHSKHGRH